MRLRLGITLWVLSWVPYGIILGVDGVAYTLCWAFEIALGLVGLAICGTELAPTIKTAGWRRAPGVAWHVLLHGHAP